MRKMSTPPDWCRRHGLTNKKNFHILIERENSMDLQLVPEKQ